MGLNFKTTQGQLNVKVINKMQDGQQEKTFYSYFCFQARLYFILKAVLSNSSPDFMNIFSNVSLDMKRYVTQCMSQCFVYTWLIYM